MSYFKLMVWRDAMRARDAHKNALISLRADYPEILAGVIWRLRRGWSEAQAMEQVMQMANLPPRHIDLEHSIGMLSEKPRPQDADLRHDRGRFERALSLWEGRATTPALEHWIRLARRHAPKVSDSYRRWRLENAASNGARGGSNA